MKEVSATTPAGSGGSATSTVAPPQWIGAVRLDRCVEIVAERGAERGLVALLDGEEVDHRRPHLLVLDVQQAGERLRLGFETLGVALGFGERLARDVERLAGRRLRRFGAQRIGFGGGDSFLRGGRRGGEAFEIDGAGGIGDELLELCGDLAVLALELGAPLVAAADRGFKLAALCREVGERGGELAEAGFARGKRRSGRAGPRLDLAAAFDAGRGLVRERLALRLEPRQRCLGVRRELALALAIRAELDEPSRELGDALLGSRRLAFEGFAGGDEPLQDGGGPRLALAQRRQVGSGVGLAGGGFRLGAGAVGDLAYRRDMRGVGLGHLVLRLHEAQVEQCGLRLADVLRQRAIAYRLAGLALQRIDLARELADDVFEPGEVLLGGAQAQLGLVAARMQSGDAGGLFQHPAALLGLRLDDLADASLVHQRRRARAGRGVGEQDLDVAGAHLAAVEAIGRALLAFDPARHLERVVAVELGGRGARRSCRCVIATSAVLRGARPLLPEKMTSSMSAARIALWEDSPITQRSASTRLDLPQPFGPTTPVSPGSIRKSVGSTKDLKPIRRNRVSFIA